MAIVDYNYYFVEYCGKVPEDDFLMVEKRAEVYLKSITHNKLTEENAPNYKNVKDCICEMADTIYYFYNNMENGAFKQVKSETTDGYSVQYSTEHKDGDNVQVTMQNKLYQIARFWLLDTGLLSLRIR